MSRSRKPGGNPASAPPTLPGALEVEATSEVPGELGATLPASELPSLDARMVEVLAEPPLEAQAAGLAASPEGLLPELQVEPPLRPWLRPWPRLCRVVGPGSVVFAGSLRAPGWEGLFSKGDHDSLGTALEEV